MATPLTRERWLAECQHLADTYAEAYVTQENEMATKDISDAQVCRAVQAYQDAIQALPPVQLGYSFGATSDSAQSLPPFPYETLAQETGQCEKVCFRAMERAADRGLIEYGVSLRTGWLTDKGRALLSSDPK